MRIVCAFAIHWRPRRTWDRGPLRAWSRRHAYTAMRVAGGLVLLTIAVADRSSETGELAIGAAGIAALVAWNLVVAALTARFPWRRIRIANGLSDLAYVWLLVAITGGADSITLLTGYAIITAWAIGYDRRTLVVLTLLLTGGMMTVVAIDSGSLVSSSQIACAAGALWVVPAAVVASTLRERDLSRTLTAVDDRRELALDLLQVESRTRIETADALHDHALQLVLVARQNLLEVQDRTPDPLLAASIDQLAEASRAMREVTNDLTVIAAADEADFGDALELAVRLQAQRAGFELRVEVTGDPPGDLRGLVLPMARELVVNAAKHAGAAQVSISVVDEEDGAFALAVRDDGRGMAPDRLAVARRAGHHGIASLQRRVRGLGGHVDVESRPGRGTTVTVHLPHAGRGTPEV